MNKRLWASVLVAIMILAALPLNSSFAETTRVTRCNLRLRAKTSTSSDTLVTIPGGTEVTVLSTSGGWTKTSYNGHTGYVSTNYLMELTKSGYYPLREGDESSYVTTLQEQLKSLGYYNGTVNGKYEKSTTEAVKSFQSQNGLKADGMAGGETQKLLFGDSAKGNSSDSSSSTESESSSNSSSSTDYKVSNTTLRTGDRGDDVKSLQTRLIELGYLSGSADGIFGAATETAVKAFQKTSSLSSDGKAGKVTQTLLYSSSAKKSDGSVSGSDSSSSSESSSSTTETNVSYTTLKRGMTSNDVKKMQERLKELGYMTANATGYFGSATLEAVELFQRNNGLATDGVAGKATQQKIFSSDAVKAGDASSGSSSSNTTKYTTLKEGMKSTAVTTMQKKLRELGYMTANATGYFGSATKAAVVAFQKNNGLSSDGVAGSATLNKLYGTDAVSSGSSSGGSSAGKISGPASSSVKLLHWQNTIKPSLKNGSVLQVFDPSTKYSWNLKAMSLGRHCDAEPVTAEDTFYMNAAFGNSTTWTPKVVYVKLPSGTWTMATTHNTPHLSGGIKDNNFDGHLCVHFLRDMAEAEKNDPNYGVQNQKVLREAWKSLTGATVN